MGRLAEEASRGGCEGVDRVCSRSQCMLPCCDFQLDSLRVKLDEISLLYLQVTAVRCLPSRSPVLMLRFKACICKLGRLKKNFAFGEQL